MATEKRLIDANALDDDVIESQHRNPHEMPGDRGMHNHEHLHFRVMISQAPTVDAVEVVHGYWEKSPHLYGYVRCSVCHDCNVWGEWTDGKKWNYCPNCGAKMDGDGNG